MEYLKKSFFVVLTTVCAFFFSISLQSAIAAWVAPTANPPAGNVATPLNVSSQGQSKDGGLILNHLNAASSGLIVEYGNVGIGTVSPAQKLDVAGNVKANQYCIGSSCISSWSQAGTGDNLGNHTATANLNIGNYEIDNASYLDIRAGDGYGVRFWSNDAYAINMGNSSEYHYGPVTDYSIKTNMSNTSGRGWTWGIDGATPVAGLSTTGNMQIAGEFKSNWIHSTGSGNNTFAGNVGIGTASPAQKLDVAGNVKANQYCIGANCVSNWGFADIACDWTGWYVVGSSVVDGCIWGCLTSVHEWGLNIYCDNGKITSASAALINVCTQCDTYSGVEGGAF